MSLFQLFLQKLELLQVAQNRSQHRIIHWVFLLQVVQGQTRTHDLIQRPVLLLKLLQFNFALVQSLRQLIQITQHQVELLFVFRRVDQLPLYYLVLPPDLVVHCLKIGLSRLMDLLLKHLELVAVVHKQVSLSRLDL